MPHLSDDALLRPPAAEKAQRSVLRYTWLLAVAFLVGLPGAYIASTNPGVGYTAVGSLWIEGTSRQGSNDVTSVRAGGLLESSAWIELLRSYQVLPPVVVDQRLYVRPPEEHASAFASFTVAERYAPGTYVLEVGDAGEGFDLTTSAGALVQRGAFGSPIGQVVGFIWTPSRTSFAPGSTVEFSVLSVREAAQNLSESLVTAMDREGSFVHVALNGSDRQEVTDVLNAVMDRTVDLAGELKRAKLQETLAILEEQLRTMDLELAEAERSLEELRVRAGTTGESSDRSLPRAERTTEEERLSRRIQTTESLYTEARGRVETARLASAGSIPDIRILDHASVSERPSEGIRLPIAAAVLFGCLGAAVGGALLLDRMVVVGAAES